LRGQEGERRFPSPSSPEAHTVGLRSPPRGRATQGCRRQRLRQPIPHAREIQPRRTKLVPHRDRGSKEGYPGSLPETEGTRRRRDEHRRELPSGRRVRTPRFAACHHLGAGASDSGLRQDGAPNRVGQVRNETDGLHAHRLGAAKSLPGHRCRRGFRQPPVGTGVAPAGSSRPKTATRPIPIANGPLTVVGSTSHLGGATLLETFTAYPVPVRRVFLRQGPHSHLVDHRPTAE
jgi:hypothetical protein